MVVAAIGKKTIMSERVLIALMICVTAIVVTFFGGLITIAVIHDDGSEAQIVTGMVSSISVGGTIVYAIVQHVLGQRTINNAVAALTQSTPINPTDTPTNP